VAARPQAGLMSPSVQAEVRRKEAAPEAQESLIERAVRIGHKMRQPAALRNGYKIRAWNYPWKKVLDAGCNCTSLAESVKKPLP